MNNYDVLRAIEARDPDGFPVEPTEADYREFRAWAIRTYGMPAWERYSGGGWGESESWEA